MLQLVARDRVATDGAALAFSPSPPPRGLVEAWSPRRGDAGATATIAGRVAGIDRATVELRDLARDPSAGPLCHGYLPTIADCCLVPQIFNAQRFNVSLAGLPRTLAAFDACMALPAFQQAQPSACPDHEA